MNFSKWPSFFKGPTLKRRRIIMLFVLGIVLPSLLLGYLAFRGIQNDRALLERERLEEHRRAAESITQSVDNSLAAVENAFFNVIPELEGDASDSQFYDLLSVVQETPLIEQVFVIRNFQDVRFPVAELLYLPNGYGPPVETAPRSSSLSARIQTAQQAEFSHRNLPGALVAYQQAFAQTGAPAVQGEILLAIARVQRKSSLFEDAVSTYETIAEEYGRGVISDGIPLGLAARLELGSLFRELEDFGRSLGTHMDILESLIGRTWILEKSQYEFFSERIKENIEAIFSDPPAALKIQPFRDEFARLGADEQIKTEITERAIVFLENAAPVLEGKISGASAAAAPSPLRMTLEIGKYVYPVSLLRPSDQIEDSEGDIWGIIFDTERLKEHLLLPALTEHIPSEDTGWIVKGRTGQVIMASETAPSETASVRTGFLGNFPEGILELYQAPPELVKTFLLSRHGIYSYMFLLIAGILIFGLILTIRSVSHELELARLKSDFVSTISHEFKSPLTSIRQLAEMLHSGRVPSEERRRQYYDVLLEQSERLSLLTDNILDFARIEEGRKEFQFMTTHIREMLEEIVASIQDRVRHEGFTIRLNVQNSLPQLKLDRSAITQAIINLIDNAIKYSGGARNIEVGSSVEGGELVFSVKDFGVGIKRDELERVFDRFYRGGDELTRTVKGSGLGLTLVREIAKAHQGNVSVESEFGKGSTFSIKLPLTE